MNIILRITVILELGHEIIVSLEDQNCIVFNILHIIHRLA